MRKYQQKLVDRFKVGLRKKKHIDRHMKKLKNQYIDNVKLGVSPTFYKVIDKSGLFDPPKPESNLYCKSPSNLLH